MRFKLQCAVALAALVFASGAVAQTDAGKPPPPEMEASRNDFPWCDGYGPMTRAGDGMSEDATGFWVAGGNRLRQTPNSGDGVAACTRALAQLEAEFPASWMRRVSLLQARALHRVEARDFQGALADLDLADQSAVEQDNPYYLRSLNINTNLIRALALIENGDRPAGEALALATWARRPYSRELITAAIAIIGEDGAQASIDTLLDAGGRMDPSLSDYSFRYRFENGRFLEALAHFDEMVAPRQMHDQTYDLRTQLNQGEQYRADAALFDLNMAGHRAYALAALGRGDEARAVMAEAREQLDAATPPAPAPRVAERPTNRERLLQVVHEQANLRIQAEAPQIRDVWNAMVEARIASGEGRLPEARAAFEALTVLPPSYAVIDLMTALRIDATTIAATRASMPAGRLGFPPRTARALFGRLLDAETQSRTASRMGGLDAAFTSRSYRDRGGCEEDARRDDGLHEVCYKGVDATLAVTEERALLRAAARSLEHGGRFRIEQRADFQHSIVSTMYGTPVGSTQAGFESRLVVSFVGAEAACDRCLTASEIQTSLGDIYAQAATPRPR